MSKKTETNRLKARLPRGLQDQDAGTLRAQREMLEAIRGVFERYGFDPLETPMIEYTEALGKFLPDQDRPNEGVFSFTDDDEQWLSLRYDLTAPLARYVAENFDRLPKPFRSYRAGYVFRNEKPGPGRFRQFMQFDADTVGAPSVAADAEMCMMMADTLEALGIERGDYVIRVNNRKVLDGVMEVIGLAGEENAGKRLTVLRAIDKLDRLGIDGVRQLLGPGRKDESGDFTKGAGLDERQVEIVTGLVAPASVLLEFGHLSDSAPMAAWRPTADGECPTQDEKTDVLDGQEYYQDIASVTEQYRRVFENRSDIGIEGAAELEGMLSLFRAAGYGSRRIEISSSVVRGLEYYTGPVYEAELTFETVNEKGEKARFGSVAGGGRYDGLVARFRGEAVPATGFSIGVSRLFAALTALGRVETEAAAGPVVVLVMDRERIADYQRMVSTLREAGIRAELYLGGSGMKAQMKYADRRGSPAVVIQGSEEHARGVVQVKDLILGAEMATSIEDRAEWRESLPAQQEVKVEKLVETVAAILERHGLD